MEELLELMIELNTTRDPEVYDSYEFTCDGEYFLLVHNGAWESSYMYYKEFVEWLKGYIKDLKKKEI